MTRHECNRIIDRIFNLKYKYKSELNNTDDIYTASSFVRNLGFGEYSVRIDVYKNGIIIKGSRDVETVEEAEDAFYNILKYNKVL